MGKPYSNDLRERVAAYVRDGHSARSAGRVFGVSASTAVRLAAADRTHGDVSAKPQGRPAGKFGKLAAHTDFLLEKVRTQPDMTLHELTAALEAERGVAVHHSSVDRALARLGQSYKKRLDRRRA